MVLEGHGVEVQRHARIRAHLAGRARNPARAEVCNSSNASGVAQERNGGTKPPLGNWVANLHGRGFLFERFDAHSRRAGGGAVDAVASRLAADEESDVTRARRVFQRVLAGYQPDGVAQRQALRVTGMAAVEGFHHGNPHRVGVISRAADGFGQDELRIRDLKH